MASTSPTTSAPTSSNANITINTNANAHASPNGNVSPTSANDAASANGTNQATTPTPSEKKQISQADVQSSMSSMPAPPAAAAAAVHQPKIVQTAFIHKLYNMLEDQSIQHLISWSPSAESFVMSPTADFSKVLAQYFKHTNISSFVRQLNMYGFHKAEQPKAQPLQPGAPTEPMPMTSDSGDPRLVGVEHTIYEMNMRLQRSEEHAHFMHLRQQTVMDMLGKAMQLNQELARALLTLVPGPDHPVHRDVVALQGEFQRQSEVLRAMDEPQEHFMSSSWRMMIRAGARLRFLNLTAATTSTVRLSPRILPSPRADPLGHLAPTARKRLPAPSGHLRLRLRALRALTRFRTSNLLLAILRDVTRQRISALMAGKASRTTTPTRVVRHLRLWVNGHLPRTALPPKINVYATPSPATLFNPPRRPDPTHDLPPPPPFANGAPGADTFGSWSFNSAGSRENKNLSVRDSSGPPTRRGSMAHILNPADTAEREGEDEDPRGDDDRKRKRVQ
ncbi:unnamed protein product [Parascedosporium putredinis]|uniref:HSF-type DNA-binding domain-containing protein n=1 Tax=Parascedosporium putredinis TaxID=1442378 RepID=A0A9P1H8R1_9PEZI|nr:unnamed protein product [Parascedosporium putredinis]CAI8001119.1 unnamed protein product [Parascedosporium putredinis]